MKKIQKWFFKLKTSIKVIGQTLYKYLMQFFTLLSQYQWSLFIIIVISWILGVSSFGATSQSGESIVSVFSFLSILFTTNVSFFGMSLTVFALVLKLTKSSIIGDYIKDAINLKQTVLLFSIPFGLTLFFLSIGATSSWLINKTGYIFLFFIPMGCLFIYNIFFIVKIVPALTPKSSLKFIKSKVEHLWKSFNHEWKVKKIQMDSRTNLNKVQIEETINKIAHQEGIKEEDVFSPALKVNQIMIDRGKQVVITNALKKKGPEFESSFENLLKIAIQIRDVEEYPDPKIIRRCGELSCPPVGGYEDFVRDNVLIKVDHAFSRHPTYALTFLYFLEGYINRIFSSEYSDDLTFDAIHQIIAPHLIEKIGFCEASVSFDLADETYRVLDRIAKKVAGFNNIKYSEKKHDLASLAFERIITTIGDVIEKSPINKNNIIISLQAKMIFIVRLLQLDIPQDWKLVLTKNIERIMKRVNNIYLGNPNLQYIYSTMWKSMLTQSYLANPYYDPNNREGITENEDGTYSYASAEAGRRVKPYNLGMLLWTIEQIDFLIERYKYYISKIMNHTDYHPFIKHLNRIFVELVRQLNSLEDTQQFNGNKFRDIIIEQIYASLVKIGTNIVDNKPLSLYHPLAPTIIIGFIHFLKDEKLPKLDPSNKVESVNFFALKFILESFKKVEITDHDTLLATNIDYIEEILAPKSSQPFFDESFYEENRFLGDKIHFFGIESDGFSQELLNLSNWFSENIYEYITNFKQKNTSPKKKPKSSKKKNTSPKKKPKPSKKKNTSPKKKPKPSKKKNTSPKKN